MKKRRHKVIIAEQDIIRMKKPVNVSLTNKKKTMVNKIK